MKWYWWLLLVMMIAGVLLMAFGDPASAEDNDWFGCTDSKAINYVTFIADLEDMGFNIVDDGNCYYLTCTVEEGCSDGTKENANYYEYLDEVYPPEVTDEQTGMGIFGGYSGWGREHYNASQSEEGQCVGTCGNIKHRPAFDGVDTEEAGWASSRPL